MPLGLAFGILGLVVGGVAVMMALPLLHGRRAVAIGLLACGILCGGWGLANVKTAMGSHRFVVLRPDAVASGGNLGLTPRAMADQSPSVLAKP